MYLRLEKMMYLPLETNIHLPLKRDVLACGEKVHMVACEEKDYFPQEREIVVFLWTDILILCFKKERCTYLWKER